ncbi:uncharacterized protein DSM5745_08873 [Aspergillus mulundensis]|uniref:Uncharacterized protein n=1 Tax=Aspergillus mulundensis TaxID=1810919 RepID=A0A3D8R4Y5_9EURO|nr:hypothetical protein DSM5745_08873 [Aspergillus mulundensis]RDW69113.1 hypothetical protein DSM5745_08873 [Aspergillus mulundensis]
MSLRVITQYIPSARQLKASAWDLVEPFITTVDVDGVTENGTFRRGPLFSRRAQWCIPLNIMMFLFYINILPEDLWHIGAFTTAFTCLLALMQRESATGTLVRFCPQRAKVIVRAAILYVLCYAVLPTGSFYIAGPWCCVYLSVLLLSERGYGYERDGLWTPRLQVKVFLVAIAMTALEIVVSPAAELRAQ